MKKNDPMLSNYFNSVCSSSPQKSRIKYRKGNSYILLLLTVLGFLSMPSSLHAGYEFQNNNTDFSIIYDNCSGIVTVKIRIYENFSSAADDWMDDLDVDINGGTRIALRNGSHLDNDFSVRGTPFTYNKSPSVSNVSIIQTGDSDFFQFDYQNLPDEDLGGTSTIYISGSWNDDEVEFEDWFRITPTQATIGTPGTVNASRDEDCGYINITWSNDNTLSACSNSSQFTEIYRKLKSSNSWPTNPTATVTFPGIFYHDTGVTPGVEYDYRIRHKFVPNLWREDYTNYSSTTSGRRKAPPVIPENVIASDDNCDGTIDLTWEWNGTLNTPDEFRVDYVSIPPPYYIINYYPNLTYNGNARSAKLEGVDRGDTYYFQIRAENTCGTSTYTVSSTGISPADPAKPTDFDYSVDPVNGVDLSWTAADNATGYLIKRKEVGVFGEYPLPLVEGGSTVSFLDSEVDACQRYSYEIYATNACALNGVKGDDVLTNVSFVPDLDNVFNDNSLTADKGYYPDQVNLQWSQATSSDFITEYNIIKKRLGSNGIPIVKKITDKDAVEWTDENTDAGVMYEYSIVARAKCNNTFVSSLPASTIGFRSPVGTVTGRVSYGSGIAVEGVQVSAESTDGIYGRSLTFDGSCRLQTSQPNSLNLNDELLLEAWIKPTSYNGDFTLFEKSGTYLLQYINNQYRFELITLPNTIFFSLTMDASEIPKDNFSHIAAQLKDGEMKLFVNGIEKASQSIGTIEKLRNYDSDLKIGIGYLGIMDEVRIWNQGKSAENIKRDYRRLMTGNEVGLQAYLRMDEGVGSYAYDISKSATNNAFNGNHAAFVGNVQWSEVEEDDVSGEIIRKDIPTSSQLGVIAYTNQNGLYTLKIPYRIGGEVFTLIPSYLTHEFDPPVEALFLGDGATVNGGIDFLDKSSFTVEGDVFFEDSDCGVKDAFVKVDGVNVNGGNNLPVQTDEDGHFEVDVPIGEHYITIEHAGHVYKKIEQAGQLFAGNRFPPTGKHNFQGNWVIEKDDGSPYFIDSTKVTVVGRVVGGLREGNKPFFEESINNIGVAELDFGYPLPGENGCFHDVVLTDAEGKYSVEVPPLNLKTTVTVQSDLVGATPFLQDKITEDDFNFSGTPPEIVTEDNPNGANVSYHKKVDLIYLVKPKIDVVSSDGVSPFIGDETYTYVDENGDPQTPLDLRAEPRPFKWPVFHQGDDKHTYRSRILVFEEYTNVDDPTDVKRDRVPTTDGILKIDNQIAQGTFTGDVYQPGQFHEIKLDEVFSDDDEVKYLDYTWKPGFPSFNTSPNPDYNYTHKFTIDYLSSTGVQSSWEPMPNGEFRGYLLGTRSNGEQIVTEGPPLPQYVLRDPPGSGSFATREKGTTETNTHNWSWNLGGEAYTTDDLYVGTKYNAGIGVQIETDIQTNINAGFSVKRSGGRNGTQAITTTNTEEWSTSSETNIAPGAASDVYVAKSQNISVGIAETLTIIPNNLIGVVPQVGSDPNMMDEAGSGFTFGKKSAYSIVEGGYETTVIITEYDIKNIIIPRIISFRNGYLNAYTGTLYINVLPTTDPNYGKNNDDPVFGTLASTPTPNTAEYADWKGESYEYNGNEAAVNAALAANDVEKLQELLTQDSVRTFNTWINKWEEAMRQNEWEKVNISNPTVIKEKKQEELDNLKNKYKAVIDWWEIIGAFLVFEEAAVYGAIAAPIPGTATIQAGLFTVTTATNIANAELAQEYDAYLLQKQRIEDKYTEILKEPSTNYTFGGNTTYTKSMTHSSATSYTRSIEFGLGAKLMIASKAEIGGNGFGVEKGVQFDFTRGRDWSTATEPTETVSYTLSANTGDLISVDVYPSILGWGPIFKTRAGSTTSCPHEEAYITEYYLDANGNGYEINPRTRQGEKPTIKEDELFLYNIPADEAAVFEVTLRNESEDLITQAYDLRVLSASNPSGAIIAIDGSEVAQSIELIPNFDLTKVIAVEKGPGSYYEYDELLLVFTSQCQYAAGAGFITDIADTVKLTAHFTPACTDIALVAPVDQWVLNNKADIDNTMVVAIADYNYNMYDLESLVFEYKSSDVSQFSPAKTFLKDNSNNPNLAQIPDDAAFIQFNWDVSELGLPDGEYDLRVRSKCTQANENSIVHSGIIDRLDPEVFGTPSPGDGILSPNDDISIKFNEPIYQGVINEAINFDIRGVTNGTEVMHSTSLSFDGVDDYVEVTGGVSLQRKDFTIEFSARRNGTGEEALISQGHDVNERLFIGFDAADRFVFRINGQEVKSNSTYTFADNIWHYFAVSYDYENESAKLFLADENTTAELINDGNTTIQEDHVASGPLIIGKDSHGNSGFFSGNIHELRIWNTARSRPEFSLRKSSLLSGSEPGLLYNWRMDEATGNLSEEHLRRRDATIVGPTWEVDPNGNSAGFDGVDDYLRVSTNDIAITTGMDFTLEFWFNSTQSGPATLFSNGTGTGLAGDALLSWNIEKDVDGTIHVKHNGEDFTATDGTDYFDGSWHHFALVLKRKGNLSTYIDGNLQNLTSSLPFQQLGGAYMYLGAHGYTVAQAETVDNHFAGKLDGFRFWNLARKAAQIKRDKQHRMNGDEPGLQLYLPFEYYSLGSWNPTFEEQIDGIKHTVEDHGGAVLGDLTPTVKIQRQVQSIPFSYSLNSDQIILTPDDDWKDQIENVTLDITVKGLRDLHGNTMASPVTWIAYMDKNQLVWQDELLQFSKMKGESLSFTSGILNLGGAPKAFEITDVPDWLTVSPQSGNINPNSSKTVHFEVDPDLAIGDYTNDIGLLTDFGFTEKLAIELSVEGEAPDWAVDPANFVNSMGIIGQLKIKNVISTDGRDILAAVVGTQVRGVAQLEYVPGLDVYLAFLDVYSNVSTGEVLEFRIWDASSGTVYSDVTPNWPFTSDALLGTVNSPKVFNAGDEVSFDVPLNAGWNWLGFPLETDNPRDITGILGSFEHTNGDQIKGLTKYQDFTNGSWTGTLDNYGAGIKPEQLYKLSTALPGTLTMRGTVIDPTTKPISLANNWNWIGFISIRNLPIAQALGNLNAHHGDLIKGKTQFATYDVSLGWIGSLKTLKPGQGFMYKSLGSNSFTYPLAGMFGNLADGPGDNLIKLNGPGLDPATADAWTPRDAMFNTNMTLLGAIRNNCGETLTGGRFAIGAFDGSGTARALAPIETLAGQEVCYLTIAGELNDQLNLRLLDTENGSEIVLGNTLTYGANWHAGDLDHPFEIEVSDEVCLHIQQAEVEPVQAFTAFPTVFKHSFTLYYVAGNRDDHAQVSITNLWGQVVFTMGAVLEEGGNRMEVDLSGKGLAAGLYTVELRTNGQHESLKQIKSN